MPEIESLAIFPLSNVVLLPEVSVPLYIFEPRYRQMTRDALDGNHQIGMVTVHPDHIDQMAGDPPIFEIGCVGRIAQAQEQPDGTFQIMLVGESRFRLLEETPPDGTRLYRSARVKLLPDRLPTGPDEVERMNTSRSELLVLLESLVRHIGSVEDPVKATEAFARLESPRLVNQLTQAIAFSAVERQRLLESDSVAGRFEIMGDLLRFRLAEINSGESGGTPLPN